MIIMQFDKLIQDPITDFMSKEDKEFYTWCHEYYEPMLIEQGKLPQSIFKTIYEGYDTRLAETDPIYRRYYDLGLEIVEYDFCIGKYNYLDAQEEELKRIQKRKELGL